MRRPTHRRHDRNYTPGPRSRYQREAHDRTRFPSVLVTAEILKELYPQDAKPIRPEWARIAHRAGWMTTYAYYATKPDRYEETKSASILRSMYERCPLIGAAPAPVERRPFFGLATKRAHGQRA